MGNIIIETLDGKIDIIKYEVIDNSDTDHTVLLEKDIKYNGWTISRNIKWVAFPSTYKWNFKHYFEFVITDSIGNTRNKLYYYYGDGDKDDYSACAYDKREELQHSFGTIPFYLNNALVFKCKNWKDYDAAVKILKSLEEIKKVIHSNLSKYEQTMQIKHCLEL